MRSGHIDGTYIDPSPAQTYRDNNMVQFQQGTHFINEFGFLIKGPVLDAGCGTGELTAYIAEKFLTPVMGFDISAERIALAKKKYLTVEFTVADAVTLSETPALSGHAYPTIVSFNALHHIPKTLHPTVFSELKKMMTADGVALLLIPQGGSGINHALEKTAKSEKWLPHFMDFDLSKIRTHESPQYYREQLEAAGFYCAISKSVKEDSGNEFDLNSLINFLRGWVPHLAHLKKTKQPESVQTDFLVDAVKLYFSQMGKSVDEKVAPTIMQNKIVAFSTPLAFFQRNKKPDVRRLLDVSGHTMTAKL